MSPAPSIVAAMDPVTLSELDSVAALLTRTDRKYVVDRAVAGEVLAEFSDRARVLDIDGIRTFRYESVYFDTPSLDSYFASARRRRHRFKVRTRTYLDTAACSLEVKLRDQRGRTEKHRQPYDISQRDRLTPEGCAFVRQFPLVEPVTGALAPRLRVTYARSTLLLDGNRTTIDAGLRCVDLRRPTAQVAAIGDQVIIETKSRGAACALDRLLWSMHIRPVRISKYGTALAALHPGLPHNKWHRTLTRHVAVRGFSIPIERDAV